GIIPARRRELAKRIGEMVGDHLLTRTVILERLQSPAVDDALYRWVAGSWQAVVDIDCGPPLEMIPADLRAAWQAWWGRGWRPVYQFVDWVVEHPELKSFLRIPVSQLLARLLESELKSFVTPPQREKLRQELHVIIEKAMASPALKKRLEKELDELGRKLLSAEKSLGEILPADLQSALLNELHRELPTLLVRFSRLLYDPEIRIRLKEKLYQGISVYIENMGFWRRLITSLAMSDDEIKLKIDQLVDDIAGDLAASLQQPEWQAKIFNLLAERLAALLALSPAMISGRLSFARVERGWIFFRKKLLARFPVSYWSKKLNPAAEQLWDHLEQQTSAGILEKLGLTPNREALTGQLVDRISQILRSRRVKRRLTAVISRRLNDWLHKQPLGRLSHYLPGSVHEPLTTFFYQLTRRYLAEELPHLSERFAVKKVVEERINNLPVEKVEDLLLGIMREHFTYINLFGALVGALIGIGQVILFYFSAR
ncbi:MAG: DUF445 family protein, partial [Deltaproteobacteria bacterium]|nr:DUF445 family protein [Deltaproteobacteria bacterium]